ncbi:MAG: hypothetical protein KIT16_03215 [Rhodospirillaceae bacterium]|nr:hypothetical protein [Rhodospirillaceae bacterium]
MAHLLAEQQAASNRFAAQEFHLATMKTEIAEAAAHARSAAQSASAAQMEMRAEFAALATSFDTIEGHVVRLAASQARHGPIQRRMAALRRVFRRPADLSVHVAAPYEPLIEHSVLSPWFTRRHRLILAAPLQPGALVAYEASIGMGTISQIVMAGALVRSRGGPLPVTLDLYDARANRVLAIGTVAGSHVAGSVVLHAAISPISVDEGTQCYVRLAGGPEIDTWGLRLYEWRSYSRLLGRTVHCGLFGSII